MIKEAIEIENYSKKFNKEDYWKISITWRPIKNKE